jgi:hypothetical protein
MPSVGGNQRAHALTVKEGREMQKLNPNKAGLVTGSLLGLWHFVWSFLVAAGLAQSLLDWIYYLHFLNNPFHVVDFNIVTAILLVAVTSVFGYFFGWLLAFLWNALRGKAVL